MTGNCWIYPKKIAQGWDATLAHLPYYSLRTKMINFIKQEEIPFAEIGTVFPNVGSFELYELKGEQEGFVKKNFEENNYIFYSNVFNDFSDEELEELDTNWQVIQSYKSLGIEVILYGKKLK